LRGGADQEEITMPRQSVKKQAAPKHAGLRNRLVGAPHRVKTPGGGTRDFLDVGYTLDEKGNLYIVRLLANQEPTTLVMYAQGAWDSIELIVNVVSEPEMPTGSHPAG
jgi:hypothetical protein